VTPSIPGVLRGFKTAISCCTSLTEKSLIADGSIVVSGIRASLSMSVWSSCGVKTVS
jgi:hypothetical protein